MTLPPDVIAEIEKRIGPITYAEHRAAIVAYAAGLHDAARKIHEHIDDKVWVETLFPDAFKEHEHDE